MKSLTGGEESGEDPALSESDWPLGLPVLPQDLHAPKPMGWGFPAAVVTGPVSDQDAIIPIETVRL